MQFQVWIDDNTPNAIGKLLEVDGVSAVKQLHEPAPIIPDQPQLPFAVDCQGERLPQAHRPQT